MTDNDQSYRNRAEELRAIADSLRDAAAKATLMTVASQYEQMAFRIENQSRPEADDSES